MGLVADSVLQLGGRVVGVIPEALKRKEIEHRGLAELQVTKSMHERKTLMVEQSPELLLDRFANYVPPSVHKWVERANT